MSQKEIPRAGLLKAALAGKITNREGAQALRLTVRQFQRLKVRFKKEGAAGLVHRSRGQPSGRGLPCAVHRKVVRLAKSTYAGFNDTHLTEKLREVEKIAIGRESVRQIRTEIGLPTSRRRRPRQHRSRRLREAREGTLVQIDGSLHDWLEGRGPRMCLHGAVDDATGALLALHFRPTEDLHGFATILTSVFTRYGLPAAIYGDGAAALVRNDPHWTLEEELQGAQNPTHLGFMLQDLGVAYIRAHSPQAKGRIENQWGTHQDRLVSELRLRGIDTIDGANAYTPEYMIDYNRRFARPPTDTSSAWRPAPRDLAVRMSCRYWRVVANDNTVTLRPSLNKNERGQPILPVRWIQIPAGPCKRSYAGCRVDVLELLDGRLLVRYKNTPIAAQPAPGLRFHLTPRESPSRVAEGRGRPNRPKPQKTSPKPKMRTKPRTRKVRDPWRGKSLREMNRITSICRG